MASNKQLTDDIIAIKPDAVVDGLKNDELAALLKELRAAPKDDAAESGAPLANTSESSTEQTVSRDYKIAAGKAVTSKRGILGPGAPVKAEYFAGGQETIDDLIEKGYIA